MSVTTGATAMEAEGRAVVIHDLSGARIACATLRRTVEGATLGATTFTPYFSYTGDLMVSGSLGPLTTSATTQTFTYSLTGVDPMCLDGAGDAANSCGVHIHSGFTCADNAGGHYFSGDVTSDPWTTVAYTTGKGTMSVTTGATGSEVNGRAVVIHEYSGARIACALLGPVDTVAFVGVGAWASLPHTPKILTFRVGSDGKYDRLGEIRAPVGQPPWGGPDSSIADSGIPTWMEVDVSGGRAFLADEYTSEVHSFELGGDGSSGPSLRLATTQKLSIAPVHLMQMGSWLLSANYGLDAAGEGTSVLDATMGGVLMTSTFVKYFSYTGDLMVTGSLGPLMTHGTTQKFAYSLSGIDPLCPNGAGDAANSCGVHIHSGYTCAENAEGHYRSALLIRQEHYTGDVSIDPWTTVAYTTGSGTMSVTTGATQAEVEGRAVVIHDHSGARIACALLGRVTGSAGGAASGTKSHGLARSHDANFVYAASAGDNQITAYPFDAATGSLEGLVAAAFVPYYSYTGDLAVAGSLGPLMTVNGTTQTFSYSLSGIDPLCAGGAGDAANSCGVHIHSGYTCAENAGGHYFTGDVTSDPWATVSYTTGRGTMSVMTGATAAEVEGRAVVIHDHSGGRIACALLSRTVATPFKPYYTYTGDLAVAGSLGLTSALGATALVPYFSYTGDLAVSGSLGPLTSSGTTQTFAYTLTGVDPLCAAGAGDAANSCGVHIHSGYTCTADAGGHLFTGDVTTDPWTAIAYTTGSGTVTVTTGATQADLEGRAVVIHDHSGARIACALLGGTQHFTYSLSGIDPDCANGASGAANSCGVHIHSGMTCTDDAGGHYYTGDVTDDPWATVAYTTGIGAVSVTTGASAMEVEGRAVVIHDRTGARIACSLFHPTSLALAATSFVSYYDYTGSLSVSGSLGPLMTHGTTQTFTYSLSGVDPACANGAGDAANSCGVHIHSGMACADNAGGHYFTGDVTSDPWTTVAYTTGKGTMSVTTGATAPEVEGRAVVIHDFTGARIACALLGRAGGKATLDTEADGVACAPRHLAFHPSRDMLYVVCETTRNATTFAAMAAPSVRAYARDRASGALTHAGMVAATPPGGLCETADSRGPVWCTGAELAVAPDGSALFLSVRVSSINGEAAPLADAGGYVGSVALDAAGGFSGAARFVSSGGAEPRSFDVDAAGTLLTVANENSETLEVFSIARDGALTRVGTEAVDGYPRFVTTVMMPGSGNGGSSGQRTGGGGGAAAAVILILLGLVGGSLVGLMHLGLRTRGKRITDVDTLKSLKGAEVKDILKDGADVAKHTAVLYAGRAKRASIKAAGAAGARTGGVSVGVTKPVAAPPGFTATSGRASRAYTEMPPPEAPPPEAPPPEAPPPDIKVPAATLDPNEELRRQVAELRAKNDAIKLELSEASQEAPEAPRPSFTEEPHL